MPNGKGGWRAHTYMQEKYPRDDERCGHWMPWVIWREEIKNHIRSLIPHPTEPADGPIVLRVEFFVPRTADLMRVSSPQGKIECFTKPDLDNYVKLVMDALSTIWPKGDGRCGIWVDDGRVCKIVASKWYPGRLEATGAGIVAELHDEKRVVEPELFAPMETPVHPRELLPEGRPRARL
jgi:Holliday junction resolvase RusA-like endonuclease